MSDPAPEDRLSKAEPIDNKTIGRTPLLNGADLEVVLSETKLPLLAGVKRSEFLYWLNNICDWTNREKLRRRLDRKTVQQMKTSIETYTTVSRALIHSNFPAPTPPLDWLREVRDWVDQAERDLGKRETGGAPLNVDQYVFTPRALGLFHAGFGIVPDNSASVLATDGRGAALRFVKTVSEIARRRIRERGVAVSVPPGLRAKILGNAASEEALRKRLEIALQYRLHSEEWTGQANLDPNTMTLQPIVHRKTDFAWRIHSEFFRQSLFER